MNKVMLTGRLTGDPELRSLASGKSVATFTLSTSDAVDGAVRIEYHAVVTWDRLAEAVGHSLRRRQPVAVEGRLQTRSWDDESGRRHWKTEVIAERVEMLSGRGKGAVHGTADVVGPADAAGGTSPSAAR